MYDDNWIDDPYDDFDDEFVSDFYDEYDFQEVDLGVTDDNWLFGTLEVD